MPAKKDIGTDEVKHKNTDMRKINEMSVCEHKSYNKNMLPNMARKRANDAIEGILFIEGVYRGYPSPNFL
jgi:hypothetical protein